jgi:hypothetical protein
MPMVRAMRMLNAIEAGTLSGANLEALLTEDAGRLAELTVLMGMRGQARRMVSSSTAMAAVAASSTAMAAVAASSTAMAAVIALSTAMAAVAASSTAMAAVAASSTAMAAVAASSTAKMAIFNSDTALNAIKASGTAMAAMRAAGQYVVKSEAANGSPKDITGLDAGGSYIMLGYSKNSAISQGLSLISTLRSGSSIVNSVAPITNASSTAGADADIAIPLVAPFQTTSSTVAAYSWYYGLLRCDI